MIYTSIENEHIKEIKKLNNKKYRDLNGKFIIEGKHLVEEAIKNNLVEEILLLEGNNEKYDVKTNYVNGKVMKYITELDNPSKIIGICHKKNDKIQGNHILILDDIQDPGNLGTIIRSAVAFNIDTIICSKDTVDFYNPKVVRASQGMMFHIPIMVMDTVSIIQKLRDLDYKIIGTKVTNGVDVRNAAIYSHFALIIGNEGQGISQEVDSLCDQFLYIKMNGNCESLNASVAASILLYEISNK